jgi:hypothetical protein
MNDWQTVAHNKKSKSVSQARITTDTVSAGSHQGDSLCLQKGYIDLGFMTSSKSVNKNGKKFNLTRSIKSLVIAGRQFEDQFAILPLYGEGNPICWPQDILNSKYALTVYYRHRLAGNNISGKMQIQSTCSIAHLKHSTSSFKQYLLEERVHINNSQLGPEEAVVLGWITGSHLAFSFHDSMRESITELMNIEYSTVEWALFPKTIFYTRSSNGVKLSTSGVSLQVTKQAAGKVETMHEDIAMM